MSKKILKTIKEGVLKIGELELNVAVLDGGVRVITTSAVFKALNRPTRGNSRVINIPVFMDAKNLQPFISKDLMEVTKKVVFIDKNGKKQTGYEASILPLVSELYLKARENGVITTKSQLATAQKAEILSRSLARVGIISLVDEATGYQYKRDKNDLQVILGAYISEEVAKWQLTFTEEFYDQIFRLWKQTYNKAKPKQSRPAFFGTLTNKYIYKPIQSGVVLDEIKQKASDDNNKARFHQYLTEDIGKKHLVKQITEVTVLMSICDDKNQFIELFKKKYDKNYQLSLFGDLPIASEKKKQKIPTELNNITKKVMDYKIDPNSPLPNNTFKKYI